MPNQTTNYGFIKPLDNETADIEVINQNMDTIDSQLKLIEDKADAAPGPGTISDDAIGARTADPTQVPTGNGPGKLGEWLSWLPNRIKTITGKPNWWDIPVKSLEQMNNEVIAHKADYVLQVPYAGTTTGSANTYAISTPTISTLTTGMAVSIKFNVDSTGTSTLNWCGLGAKGIKKANGADITNLKATGIYTLRYDGTNFIVQGEGASGDATASDLLAGKKASTDAGDITGTMPNRGNFSLALGASVPAGYYSGGTVPTAPVPTHSSQSYTTAGTYNFTVPTAVYFMLFVAVGGGGGGGGGCAGGGGGGGGAGGTYVGSMSVTPGQVLSCVVGAGGTNGNPSANAGTNGGNGGASTVDGTGGGGGKGGYGAVNSVKGDGGAGGTGGGYGTVGNAGVAGSTVGGTGGVGYNGYGSGGDGMYGNLFGATSGSSGEIVLIW